MKGKAPHRQVWILLQKRQRCSGKTRQYNCVSSHTWVSNSNVNSGGPESSEDDTEVLDRQPKLEVGNSTFYHSTEVIHTDEEQEELKSQEFIFGSEEPFVEEEVDDKTHQVWSLFHIFFFANVSF